MSDGVRKALTDLLDDYLDTNGPDGYPQPMPESWRVVARRVRSGVSEIRWYRFGYIGPMLGEVEEVYPGQPMRLVRLSIRDTTEEERAPGGRYEWSDTVAVLTWESALDSTDRP